MNCCHPQFWAHLYMAQLICISNVCNVCRGDAVNCNKKLYTNRNLQLGSLSISWSSEVHTFGTQAAQKLLVQHNHEGQLECVDQQRKSPQTLMDDHTQEVASHVA